MNAAERIALADLRELAEDNSLPIEQWASNVVEYFVSARGLHMRERANIVRTGITEPIGIPSVRIPRLGGLGAPFLGVAHKP